MLSYFLTLAQQNSLPDLPPNVQIISNEAVNQGMSTGQTILSVIYALVAVGLIIAVLTRTTKSEGLSGSMMGPSESVFRGKKSAEDSIDIVTNVLAVSWLVLSLIVAYVR